MKVDSMIIVASRETRGVGHSDSGTLRCIQSELCDQAAEGITNLEIGNATFWFYNCRRAGRRSEDVQMRRLQYRFWTGLALKCRSKSQQPPDFVPPAGFRTRLLESLYVAYRQNQFWLALYHLLNTGSQ